MKRGVGGWVGVVLMGLVVGPGLASPGALAAQEAGTVTRDPYRTVTGRLHPAVEVRVQFTGEPGDWVEAGLGWATVPTTAGNMVSCTMISLPVDDPRAVAFLRPLHGVEVLLVRRRGEEEWTPMELEAVLEAEPEACETL